jgi:AcrR family transcriptional regulator
MSVRELARDLGVSHNLIPQRIGSKEQLWFSAVNRGFGALALELAQAIAEQEDEADDLVRLRALVVRWIEANTARPALLRIINQEATAPGPRLDYLFDRYIAPVREFGDDLLARLAKEGKVRTNSAPLMYFLMTHGAGGPFILPGLAEKFGTPLDASDHDAVRDHARAMADIIFDGLLVN